MNKNRLQKLAGIQLKEEFTDRDWQKGINILVDMILDMAKSDSDGDEDEFVDNVENYSDDAVHDLKATIAQRVRNGFEVK